MNAAARRTRFRVEGMDCASCAAKIDKAVRRIPDVTDVNVSVVAGTVSVEHGDKLDLDTLAQKVNRLGYKATRLGAVKKSKAAETAHGQGRKSNHADHDHEHVDHDHSGHDHAGHAHGPKCNHDHPPHDHGDHDHTRHDHSAHVHGADCKHDHADRDHAGTVIQAKIALRVVLSRRLRRQARIRPAFASPAWIARAARPRSTPQCVECRMLPT